VRVVSSLDEVRGKRVAIGAHGVSPEVESAIRERSLSVVDTTCPFVHRAQLAAKGLADAGFFTVVFGESEHPEIRSVLGLGKEQGSCRSGCEGAQENQGPPTASRRSFADDPGP